MRYHANGFRKNRGVSNNEVLFTGNAGCWGMLAGSGIPKISVVNQIVFETQYKQFQGSSFFKLKPENLTDQEFLGRCVDAINEGYLDYEISEGQNQDLVITFNNLHDKLRQRTMWILFTIRSMLQFLYNDTNISPMLLKSKMSLTLREKIIYSQLLYRNSSGIGRNANNAIYTYNTGGHAAYLTDMTMADFRAMTRGGAYYTGSEVSKMIWGVGGGYYSSQDVQDTARAAQTAASLSHGGLTNNMFSIIDSVLRPKGNTISAEEGLRKLIRLVKYYKKD